MRALLLFSAALAAQACLHAADDAAPKPQDLGWCTVTAPAQAGVGLASEITVTLNQVPAGMAFVTLDLHSRGAAKEYIGVNSSGGAKAATLKTPLIWKITVLAQPGLAEIIPTIYLSSAGNWGTKGDLVNAAPINVR